MDDRLEYDEHADEKFLIGDLLDDDTSDAAGYSPTKEVRNIQRTRNVPTSFNHTMFPTTNPWAEYPLQQPNLDWCPLTPTQSNEWTRYSSQNVQPFNYVQESAENFRYTPLSLSFGQSFVQPKPTATVPPFQTLNDLNKSDDTSSPSDRASDSGTISPDSLRPNKQIKWKKLDLAALESKPKAETFSRQNSEITQQNGKSYSSVAQVNGHHQQHKRLGATSSVPISKSSTPKNFNTNKKPTQNFGGRTQPTTPIEETLPPKPSKIVGLNPINSNSTHVLEAPKMHTPNSTTVASSLAVSDFQKIKRKKKGKTNSKKADAKQLDEQKSGSRYSALVQSDSSKDDDFSLENGPSDDEDEEEEYFDESEYQRQEEEEKEQIRQQARRQFENDKVSEEEANEKMKKLENEIRVIFEKRKTAKQQRISSQRHRRRKNGYQNWLPAIFTIVTSALASAVIHSFTFFINLVTNVLVLSFHALTDSFKSLFLNLYQLVCSFFLVTIGTVFKNSRNFLEQLKQCGAVNSQIGLTSNAPYPCYCEDVLERLYDCSNADAFCVLGLTKSATHEEICSYFKKNSGVMNLNKNYNVGSEEARILLQTAYELVCTDERKNEYLNELELLPQTYMLQVQLDEFRYLINTKGAILHCEGCGENHPIIRVSNYDGRYCVKCNQTHAVKNGDLWVEKQYFGWLSTTFFAVINNKIYDVTEWGNCSANCLKRPKPNPHMITHRLYNASVNAAVTNVTEKHRCSIYRADSSDRSTRSIVLPKEPMPWKYSCCCSLLVCSPNDSCSAHDVPCCFGGIFIAVNTTAAPAMEKLAENEKSRKAGRRRRYNR